MTATGTTGPADGGARAVCSCGETIEPAPGGWRATDPVLLGLDWGDHRHAPAAPPSPPAGRCGCGSPVTLVHRRGRERWLDPSGGSACPDRAGQDPPGEHQAVPEVVPPDQRCTVPGCANRAEDDGMCPPCVVVCGAGGPLWADFTERGELEP